MTGSLEESEMERFPGRRPCVDRGGGWSDAATSQEMPRATESWMRPGRTLPQSPEKGCGLPTPYFQTSGGHLTFRLPVTKLGETKFLFLQAPHCSVVICAAAPGNCYTIHGLLFSFDMDGLPFLGHSSNLAAEVLSQLLFPP